MARKRPNNSSPSAAFDVVAVAASAGGLKALSDLLSALPAEFPAAVVVVQHLDPRHRSLMAEILSRRTALKVKQAEEGDLMAGSFAYVAPPNRHLLVNPDVDLRDGCTRGPGSDAITYADGDGVMVPSGSGNTRYVVVWVDHVQRVQSGEHKRVYLVRDTAAWPGP